MRMEIEASFDTVYLINGRFFESVRLNLEPSEVVYVTVLPLEGDLLSYTVKLIGAHPLNANGLCLSYKLNSTHYYIKLLPKHNYVFSPQKQHKPKVTNNIYEFFKEVKANEFDNARKHLSTDLSETIDNRSLSAFFEDFYDIVENKSYLKAGENSYFLIDKSNQAHLYTFSQKNGKITDISGSETN